MIYQLTSEAYCSWGNIPISLTTRSLVFLAVLCPAFAPCQRPGRVTKIAIDKRARESANKGHEDSLAGVLPASGRLLGEEAAGDGDPASNT